MHVWCVGRSHESENKAGQSHSSINPITSTQHQIKRKQALKKYGSDLTSAAEDSKLDPVIGRDEEIRRVIQVRYSC